MIKFGVWNEAGNRGVECLSERAGREVFCGDLVKIGGVKLLNL